MVRILHLFTEEYHPSNEWYIFAMQWRSLLIITIWDDGLASNLRHTLSPRETRRRRGRSIEEEAEILFQEKSWTQKSQNPENTYRIYFSDFSFLFFYFSLSRINRQFSRVTKMFFLCYDSSYSLSKKREKKILNVCISQCIYVCICTYKCRIVSNKNDTI